MGSMVSQSTNYQPVHSFSEPQIFHAFGQKLSPPKDKNAPVYKSEIDTE